MPLLEIVLTIEFLRESVPDEMDIKQYLLCLLDVFWMSFGCLLETFRPSALHCVPLCFHLGPSGPHLSPPRDSSDRPAGLRLSPGALYVLLCETLALTLLFRFFLFFPLTLLS